MTRKRIQPKTRPAPARSNGPSRVVNVGLTQMACSDDARKNLANQVLLAEQAAKQGAQVICTQELFHAPNPSSNSDQPTIPSSVVSLTK